MFLLSVLLLARAVRWPSASNQALGMVGLGVLAFTRIQGVALVGAYVAALGLYAMTGAVSERRRYLVRVSPRLSASSCSHRSCRRCCRSRGGRPLRLARYSIGTFDQFHPHEIPQWFVYLTGDLVLYVAVAPLAATVVVMAMGLSRRASAPLRLFAAVALPTALATLVSVSLVSASLDVDGVENLNERYSSTSSRSRSSGLQSGCEKDCLVADLGCCGLSGCAAFWPESCRLNGCATTLVFSTSGLMPRWLDLSLSRLGLTTVVAGFVLVCSAAWLYCSRGRAGCSGLS